MAKKSKRARAVNKITPKPATSSPVQTASAMQKSNKQPAAASAGVAQTTDYGYVSKDLISIGIITAVLILVLIILTFIPALNT